VVGEGNVFTKGDLRKAFEGVSQIDRRMRELRSHDWQIDTNREDASLEPSEHRFVKKGTHVWEPGKGARKTGEAIGAGRRRAVLVNDNYLCRSCGIGNGEEYSAGDFSATSQLDVARRPVRRLDGKVEIQLVTECNRCRVGGGNEGVDVEAFVAELEGLSVYERKMLSAWMEQDSRGFSEVERLWGLYRTLPADARAEVRGTLT
jgi:hypothetical protein